MIDFLLRLTNSFYAFVENNPAFIVYIPLFGAMIILTMVGLLSGRTKSKTRNTPSVVSLAISIFGYILAVLFTRTKPKHRHGKGSTHMSSYVVSQDREYDQSMNFHQITLWHNEMDKEIAR